MKDSRGFTLIEVMVALIVLGVGVGTIFPALVLVQQERMAIREERMAEEVLLYHYRTHWNSGVREETIVEKGEKQYTLSTIEWPKESILCVTWEGKNGRDYKRCLSEKQRRSDIVGGND